MSTSGHGIFRRGGGRVREFLLGRPRTLSSSHQVVPSRPDGGSTRHRARKAAIGATLVLGALGPALSAIAIDSAGSPAAASTAPTLTTDAPDYAPFETATITGTGLSPSTAYAIPILRPDGSYLTSAGTTGWDTVTTDASGALTYQYALHGIDGSYAARAYPAPWDGNWSETPVAEVDFLDSSASLAQCTNGGVGPPLDIQPCVGSNTASATVTNSANTTLTEKNWVNGNANGSKSHWREGDFISYRAVLSSVGAGTHDLVFHYDPVRSGGHAIDYLGSYDYSETTSNDSNTFHFNNNSPCADLVNASLMTAGQCTPASPVSTTPIGAADLADANNANCGSNGTFSGSQIPGTVDLYGPSGDVLNSITYSSQNVSQGTGTCQTTMDLNFTLGSAVSSSQAIVITWGGHIASQHDWGVGNSATAISGSPYHMSLDTLDGASQGSQDRSLASSAVVFTPTLATAVENASNVDITNTQIPLGSVVHDTATLGTTLNPADPSAGGTVTYTFFNDGTCSAGTSNVNVVTTQNVTVTNAVVPDSSPTSALGAGSYSYLASYGGDGSDLPATAPCEPFTVGQGTTSTSTTLKNAANDNTIANGSSLTLGTSVYDTATITPTPSGTVTGTVSFTFYDDSTCGVVGATTGNDVAWTQSGVAIGTHSNATGALSPGSYSFQATYSGDGNYSGSTATCEPFTVGQGTTSTSTTLKNAANDNTITNGSSLTLGTSVYDTATVTPTPAGTLTGTVTFTFYSDGTCGVVGGTSGNDVVSTQSGVAVGTQSNATGALTPGSYSFQAIYSGDSNYTGSTATCEPFSVSQGSSSTSTTLKNAADDSTIANGTALTLGTSVYDTATVTPTPSGSFTPTGTITFTFFSDGTCGVVGGTSGHDVVSTQSGVALGTHSNATGALSAGSYSFLAVYTGDTNYTGSTASCEPFSVNQGTTSTSTTLKNAADDNTIANGTALTLGTSVYDTATVTPTPAGFTTSGTVTFTFFSDGTCGVVGGTSGHDLVSTQSGVAVGTHSNATGALGPGSYSFQATYSGDPNYTGSTATCEPFSVNQGSTTTSTTLKNAANDNTIANGTALTLGTSVYDTATVTPTPSGTLTGTVTFTFYSDGTCGVVGGTSGHDLVSTQSGVALGTHSNATGALTPGSYSFQALYSGDSNYTGSTADCEPFSVSQGSSSTSTTLKNAADDSTIANGTALTLGTSVYDTATVTPTPSGSFTPTGTITFTFFSDGTCGVVGGTSGHDVVSTQSGVALGTHSNATGALGPGSYSFLAVYTGDTNYTGSTASCEPFSVNQGSTVTSTTLKNAANDNTIANGTALTLGTSVYDTATVTPTPAGTLTGTVTFTFFSDGTCGVVGGTSGHDVVSTQSGVAVGTHSNATGALTPGSYSFQATYSGDSNYTGSTATCEPFSVNQGSSATSTTLKNAADDSTITNGSSVALGTSVYDTATVTPTPSGSFTPTGTITFTFFSDGTCGVVGGTSGNDVVSTQSGVALGTHSDATGALTPGSYSFLAVYTGDTNYTGSTASCEPFTVNQGSTDSSTTLKNAANNSTITNGSSVALGTSVYDTATVVPTPSGTLSGTVTFTFFSDGTCGVVGGTGGHDVVWTQSGVALGTQSNSTGALGPGSYSFLAVYTGDTNYTGSTASCEPFTVNQGSTSSTTTLHNAADGSTIANGSFIPPNSSVYDTVTVTPNPVTSFALTGTVTFIFYNDGNCTPGTANVNVVWTESGVALGTASNPTGPLPSGMYSFQAIYSGDANYTGSTASCEPFLIGQPALTPGYWKNHLSVTMAIIGANQPFYIGNDLITTAQQVTDIFSAMNCSNSKPNNAIGCLAGQLLAAELNVDNLAPTTIMPTINAAQAFLTGHSVTYGGTTATGVNYTGPGSYNLSGPQRTVALALTSDLSNYNASGV